MLFFKLLKWLKGRTQLSSNLYPTQTETNFVNKFTKEFQNCPVSVLTQALIGMYTRISTIRPMGGGGVAEGTFATYIILI